MKITFDVTSEVLMYKKYEYIDFKNAALLFMENQIFSSINFITTDYPYYTKSTRTWFASVSKNETFFDDKYEISLKYS